MIFSKYKLTLLPEIHASYAVKNYEMIANEGYMTYGFFLPGLVIDALERGSGDVFNTADGISFIWEKYGYEAELEVDFSTIHYSIIGKKGREIIIEIE